MTVEGVSFSGIHCDSLGLKIAQDGTRRPLFAESKDDFVDVPHRSGSILVYDTSRKDLNVEVDFILTPLPGQTIHDAYRNITTWLTGKRYREPLIFDDDPEYAYQAKVVSSLNREDISGLYSEFTITFRCSPGMLKVSDLP